MIWLTILIIISSLAPAESVYHRHPELRDEESIAVVYETVGEGPEKDKIRFPD